MKNKRVRILILFLIFSSILSGCVGKSDKSEKEDTLIIEAPTIVVNNDSPDYIVSAKEQEAEPTEEVIEEAEYQEIYDDVNKEYSREATSREEAVLLFAGDTCFYDGFSLMGAYRDRGENIENCIDASLLSEMRSADIFMINNEFCYSDRGAPIEGKQYAFRSKPENVKILSDMGADIVSLANNHAYDWGPDALCDSIDVLNEAKIPFVGAGKNIEEAMKPAYFTINDIKIAFVSATQIERVGNPDTKEATETSPGVLRTLNSKKACQVISTAKANADFVVMYVHWGSENTDLVEQSQRDLAKDYVEAGADLIIGDHSHCLQGIDFIDSVPVFYSLGNYWFNSKTVDTGLAKIRINNESKITGVQFIPAKQTGCKTVEVDESESARILNYLQGISNYAQIDPISGVVTESSENHNTQNGQNTSPTKKTEVPTENSTENNLTAE